MEHVLKPMGLTATSGTPRPSVRMSRVTPRFLRSVGFGPVSPPFRRLHHGAVEGTPLEVESVFLPVVLDQPRMDPPEDAPAAPLLHAEVARRAGSDFTRQCLPLAAGAEAIGDSRQHHAIRAVGP